MKVVVLVSGRGSNLKALREHLTHRKAQGRHPFSIETVISDRPQCEAMAWAKEVGIHTQAIAPATFATRELWNDALAQSVHAIRPDLVVLAGFMRIIGSPVIEAARHTIINVHPSLLPSFPGAHAVDDALKSGVRITGCTVHQIDSGVDTGPIIAQAAVAVRRGDDASTLHARIQTAEHRILPAVVEHIAEGNIILSDKLPNIRPPLGETPGDVLFSPAGLFNHA